MKDSTKSYEVNFSTKMGMTAAPSRKVRALHPADAARLIVLSGVPSETYSFSVVDSRNRMVFCYAAAGHLVGRHKLRA